VNFVNNFTKNVQADKISLIIDFLFDSIDSKLLISYLKLLILVTYIFNLTHFVTSHNH